MEKQKSQNGILNKVVKFFYDDGVKITPKQGLVIGDDLDFYYILNENKEQEGIPKKRIIRFIVIGLGEEKHE